MACLFDKGLAFTEMQNKPENQQQLKKKKTLKNKGNWLNVRDFKKLEWDEAVLLLILSEGTTKKEVGSN